MTTTAMPNFILVSPEYERLPDLLLDEVEGFAATAEYTALSGDQRRVPEAVCAALMRLLLRLRRAEQAGRLGGRERAMLSDINRAIDKLVSRPEVSVRNALGSAMFETLTAAEDRGVLQELMRRFGIRTRRILDRWAA